LGRNNTAAKALSGDINIHWTSIADFISHNGAWFQEIFAGALAYRNELGLTGGDLCFRRPEAAVERGAGTNGKERAAWEAAGA